MNGYAPRMGEKKFRTRKQWHNTMLVLWTAPVLLLTGVFIGVTTGNFGPLVVLVVLAGFGVVLGMRRDRSARSTYAILNDVLVIVNPKERLELRAEEIMDASLVDRAAARNYISIRAARSGKDKEGQRAMQDAFLRFCTVDIGLRSLTFRAGTRHDRSDAERTARYGAVAVARRTGPAALTGVQPGPCGPHRPLAAA
ncbi:MAG: hypothetical protein IPG92_09000 [Flavobacteriales bacterium]|nr:hypothetical protein [Flavobacteriales bacterium]